jgi:TetR/AcrR family transcriptional regulator, transcriptional repressor for nem operon
MKQHPKTEFPETKRKLVDASVSLMRSRGFNGTSLDTICEAAQVTKGGFFHYFKNKEDIAKTALARFCEKQATALQDAPFNQLADPLERVYGYLDFIQKTRTATASPKGCLVGMFAQEMSFTNSELRKASHESLQLMGQRLEKDLAAAQALHAPTAPFDPKSIAAFFVAIFQGSLIMAKTDESDAILVENLEHFRRYIRSFFPGPQ